MAIPKVLGTETEFGILIRGADTFNPSLASALVVNSVGEGGGQFSWSYDSEQPRSDARSGTHIEAFQPDYEAAAVNTVLSNGARFYVDHAHPEYSSPETIDPRRAALYDVAGEEVCRIAMASAQRLLGEGEVLALYKNNSDGKGNSYGYHENVLLSRSLPFGRIVEALPTFLVSRQLISGSGKVGSEAGHPDVEFQLTQRADFFEEVVGLETTLRRPLVNTRDEPHADHRYRRLHVIHGDATRSEVQTWVKLGALSLFLGALEDDAIPDDLALAEPVVAGRVVSRDLTFTAPLRLEDGRQMTALDLQWQYHQWCGEWATSEDLEWSIALLDAWAELLSGIEQGPDAVADRLDWAAKHRLLSRAVERGASWDDPRIRTMDLQYHDLRPERGLYQRLVERGAMRRLFDDEEIRRAAHEPPDDTRAYFRGRCVERFGADLIAANWDALIFDDHRGQYKRVPMLDPLRGTKAHVADLLDDVEDVEGLLDALQGGGE
jgi:proteasome accessory factor PafA2